MHCIAKLLDIKSYTFMIRQVLPHFCGKHALNTNVLSNQLVGLSINWKNRNLYFTNIDFVSIEGVAYSWHKIEALSLERGSRIDVVTHVEEPRGLWVDVQNQ